MEHHQQVWLYGEIVHGAVSGEASCTENTDAMGATTVVFNEAICNEASLKSTKPASANDRLALFRQATSLEAFGGIRYEFATLNRGTKNPANVYVKGQVGFLTVAAGGSDVKDIHHVGAGVVLTKGRLQDSYFEFGWGKNDVFADGEQRYKVDVFLSLGGGGAVSPFAQFVMDADFGPKADSIQSFLGSTSTSSTRGAAATEELTWATTGQAVFTGFARTSSRRSSPTSKTAGKKSTRTVTAASPHQSERRSSRDAGVWSASRCRVAAFGPRRPTSASCRRSRASASCRWSTTCARCREAAISGPACRRSYRSTTSDSVVWTRTTRRSFRPSPRPFHCRTSVPRLRARRRFRGRATATMTRLHSMVRPRSATSGRTAIS